MTRGVWGDPLRAARPARRLVTAAALGLILAGAAAALSAGPATAGAVRAASGVSRADGAGWCLTGSASSVCAHFFGGVTRGSTYALMWQWSGGGGSRNGVGDFDQIDANRTP
jgi:hypothetical protein